MLLDALLSKSQAMENNLSSQCNDLERATSRLGIITAHDALILLRAFFSTSKLQHIVHASPCYDSEHLLKFDELHRTAISKICNVSLSNDQWLQASLPAKSGGLHGDLSCVFTCIICFSSRSRVPTADEL